MIAALTGIGLTVFALVAVVVFGPLIGGIGALLFYVCFVVALQRLRRLYDPERCYERERASLSPSYTESPRQPSRPQPHTGRTSSPP